MIYLFFWGPPLAGGRFIRLGRGLPTPPRTIFDLFPSGFGAFRSADGESLLLIGGG